MRKILNLLLLFLALISCHAQNTSLTLNLEEGKEYNQVASSKTTITQTLEGQKIDIIMTINGGMSFKVISDNPSDYDLEVKYTGLSMIMDMPQGKIEFNSAKNDEQDIMSTVLSKMVGKAFNVKMAKTGKIIEVKNIESVIDSVFEHFAQYMSENQLEQMKEQMENAYGAEAFKGNIEMTTAIFPDKPVSKGDKWTIVTNLQSGMAALMTTEYQFVDLKSDFAIIKGNSIIKTEDKDAYVESNGMPMKYDLNGSMVSEIKVDRETGWIIKANIKQEIKGDAYIKENPQLPDGLKIPMIMKNEMTISDR